VAGSDGAEYSVVQPSNIYAKAYSTVSSSMSLKPRGSRSDIMLPLALTRPVITKCELASLLE
jgi:hypothetical protein